MDSSPQQHIDPGDGASMHPRQFSSSSIGCSSNRETEVQLFNVMPLDIVYEVFHFLTVKDLLRSLEPASRQLHGFLATGNHRLWNHFWARYHLENLLSDPAVDALGLEHGAPRPPTPPDAAVITGMSTAAYLGLLHDAAREHRPHRPLSPAAADVGETPTRSSVLRSRRAMPSMALQIRAMAASGADERFEAVCDLQRLQAHALRRSASQRVPPSLVSAGESLLSAMQLETRLGSIGLTDSEAGREVLAEFSDHADNVSAVMKKVQKAYRTHSGVAKVGTVAGGAPPVGHYMVEYTLGTTTVAVALLMLANVGDAPGAAQHYSSLLAAVLAETPLVEAEGVAAGEDSTRVAGATPIEGGIRNVPAALRDFNTVTLQRVLRHIRALPVKKRNRFVELAQISATSLRYVADDPTEI